MRAIHKKYESIKGEGKIAHICDTPDAYFTNFCNKKNQEFDLTLLLAMKVKTDEDNIDVEESYVGSGDDLRGSKLVSGGDDVEKEE